MKSLLLKRVPLLSFGLCASIMAVYAAPKAKSEDPALSQMKTIKDIILDYNIRHGAPISKTSDIMGNIAALCKEGRFPSYRAMLDRLCVNGGPGKESSFIVPFHVRTKRFTNEPYTAPREAGSKDLLLYNDKFFQDRPEQSDPYENNPQGFYMALWDDYSISKIPYDMVVYTIKPGKTPNSIRTPMGFVGEGGLLPEGLSYGEFWGQYSRISPPIGKKLVAPRTKMVPDNGMESLVMLSRQLCYPDEYGLDRNQIWQEFDATKPKFTLDDVQLGAEHLGLLTQVATLSLDDLQRMGTPAIVQLTDGRLLPLLEVDDDSVVVVTGGITRIIYRYVFQRQYSGQSLVPQQAITTNSALQVDNPVQVVHLAPNESEMSKQVKLRNTGETPVTLRFQYPLLGITQAHLSKNTLAPGDTATLDFQMHWRPTLHPKDRPTASAQNVLLPLLTNDPVKPRLQLSFILTAPHTETP